MTLISSYLSLILNEPSFSHVYKTLIFFLHPYHIFVRFHPEPIFLDTRLTAYEDSSVMLHQSSLFGNELLQEKKLLERLCLRGVFGSYQELVPVFYFQTNDNVQHLVLLQWKVTEVLLNSLLEQYSFVHHRWRTNTLTRGQQLQHIVSAMF